MKNNIKQGYFIKFLKDVEKKSTGKMFAYSMCKVALRYVQGYRYVVIEDALYAIAVCAIGVTNNINFPKRLLEKHQAILDSRGWSYSPYQEVALACLFLVDGSGDAEDFYEDLLMLRKYDLLEERDVSYHNIPKGFYDYDGFRAEVEKCYDDAMAEITMAISEQIERDFGQRFVLIEGGGYRSEPSK